MTLVTAHEASGATVRPGEVIRDFRGDEWTFMHATRPRQPGKTGKVLVTSRDGQFISTEYYDTVFDLAVTEM